MTAEQLEVLVARFDALEVEALVLVGSHARGDAGPDSDVDLWRFVLEGADLPGRGSHFLLDRLVNVSDAVPEEVEGWFARPEQAVDTVLSLRDAKALTSRTPTFGHVQARAHAFVWDAAMQREADTWASVQLVGWAEEALKGSTGLRRDDVGRLLLARFGLSWGLARTVRVQRGLLGRSENTFFADLETAFAGTRWLERLRDAYGLTGLTLSEQVRAGLELYTLTAELLDPVLRDIDRPLITYTVRCIRESG